MIRYHFDLYPRDDPRDGALLVRFTKLQSAEYRGEANGTGAGRFSLRGDTTDAGFIDPAGLQYVRVVREDTVAVTEAVVGGFFLDNGDFTALDDKGTRLLVFSGAGTLSYLGRAVMAPHTYISPIFTGQDPFDDTWRLYAQSTVYANGNYLGAMLWRVIYEAQHFTPGSHKHADGIIVTDTHADDRTESAIPDLVMGFDQFDDSAAGAWTASSGEFKAQIGENVLQIVKRLMEAGLYVSMDPDTFELDAWQAAGHGRTRTGGAWGASVVRFQAPSAGTVDTGNIKSDAKRGIAAFVKRSLLWAGGSDVYAKSTTGGSDIPWEGFYPSDATDTAALTAIATVQLGARSDAGDTLRLRMKLDASPTTGKYLPFESAGVLLDDTVTVHTGTGQWDYNEDTFPVAALTVQLRRGGDWDAWADLSSTYTNMAERAFQARGTAGPHTHPPNPKLCRDTGPVWQQTTSGVALDLSFDGSVLTASSPFGIGAVTRWADVSPGGEALPIERLWRVLMHWDEDVDNWSVILLMDGQPDPNGSSDWAYLTFGVVGGFFTAALESSEGGSDSHSFGAAGGDDQEHEFFVRVRLESGAFRARIWDVVDAEPGTWTVEDAVTDESALDGALESLGVWLVGVANDTVSTNNFEVELLEPVISVSCIHGGPEANSGDASVACGKCVAPGNHEHDYVAAGGTTGQALLKASGTDWDTEWGTAGAPTTADYLVGTAQAGLSAEIVVGTTPGGELGGTWAAPTVDATHAGGTHAPTAADYLVGTAQAGLSAEIVVGATPGGELGGTWASPTVDATHSGSTHSASTDTHIADTADAHDASAVSVLDTGGYFTGTDVEAALQEIGAGGYAVDALSAKASGSGDVTTTASLADVTGATLSLEAGTYVVVGIFDTLVNNALNDRTFEGHLDVGGVDENDYGQLVAPGLVNVRATIPQSWRIVLASTTTVKLRTLHSGGTVGDFTVKSTNTTITAYRAGGGSDLSGKELDYAQRTTNLSPVATTEATAETLITGAAVAYDGSTTVMIEFYADALRPAATAAAGISAWLYEDGVSIGRLALINNPAAATMGAQVHAARRLTPTNASHTYSIRVSVSTGTGTVLAGAGGSGAGMPAFLRITRV